VTTGCTDSLADGLIVNPLDDSCRIPPAQATAEPGALTFTGVAPGASSNQAVTVTNTGGAPLTITSVVEVADSDNYYTLNSGGCAPATVLPAEASCSFSITYAPAVAGTHTATFQVNTDANDPIVSASGTSVTP
jgi:hypothetical protein